ncbi:MAG: alpha-E domain-containing protein [Aphanocapsa feldmannii 288cV]|nr:MAG: alpha-E domain-containing protein [Aphanocapsa feldmannii 288cV]
MLSRVADSLYWMARYVERVENLCRFLQVAEAMALDAGSRADDIWLPLVDACGDRALFDAGGRGSSPEAVADFLLQSPHNPSAIRSCISLARENARQIREVITTEMWEQLNTIYLRLQEEGELRSLPSHGWLGQLRRDCQLFFGITDSTLSRNKGWQFSRIGRLIERADKTARILDVKYFLILPRQEAVGGMLDQLQWISLLRTAGAYQMFRQNTRKAISPTGVAGFLLLDEHFPRSVCYCLNGIAAAVDYLTDQRSDRDVELGRFLALLRSRWCTSRFEDLISQGLHESIDSLQAGLNTLHCHIEARFFTTAAIPRKGAVPAKAETIQRQGVA